MPSVDSDVAPSSSVDGRLRPAAIEMFHVVCLLYSRLSKRLYIMCGYADKCLIQKMDVTREIEV